MLDLRQRIILTIAIAIGLVLAFLLVYLVVLPRVLPHIHKTSAPLNKSVEQTTQQTTENGNSSPNVIPGVIQSQVTPLTSSQLSLKAIVRTFVERFDSYSNQDNNKHIADVIQFATPHMVAWIKTQTKTQSTKYQGVTTHVLVERITSQTDTDAKVAIQVQKIMSSNGKQTITYPKGSVALVKMNGEWKVDGLYWK